MERMTKKQQLAGLTVNYVGVDNCFDVWTVPKSGKRSGEMPFGCFLSAIPAIVFYPFRASAKYHEYCK